jgi:hypothetical protein
MGKKPLLVQKRPPKKLHFQKNSFFQYFFSPEALSNSSTVQLSQKQKNSVEKCQKKGFFEIFSKKFFFLSDFLDFLIFFLNLGLNPHIHLFFQLSSCTSWFTIKDFPIYQKPLFCLFLDPSTSAGMFFFTKSTLIPCY